MRPEEAERLGDLDALGTYLREIGRYPLLTAEQEVRLAKRIEAGVKAQKRLAKGNGGITAPKRRELERSRRDGGMAKHDMVQANLRLVVSIARRYRATGIPLLDLVQEGNIGLMRAVDKFDWRKGFKFSTYATWWIRQAIQRGIADRGRAIRLPVHVHELLVRVRRARSELEAQLGREATDDEVAKAARLLVVRVRELRGLAANLLSLETPVGEAGEATLGEFVPDETASVQFDEVLSVIGREELERVLSTLTGRERTILALRFGLTGEEPLTLEEVGRRFGLTRERIRQLEAKALAKLRHPSRSAVLRTEGG
ncbi:MAG: sigma-70 family RNA polymerase sigma factor [Acidobacteria bacterium]|nr:sigma-70 family RNA polymerase sigma factor [Acidobacteriota bacterium]